MMSLDHRIDCVRRALLLWASKNVSLMGNFSQFGKLRMRLGNCAQNPRHDEGSTPRRTFDKQGCQLAIQTSTLSGTKPASIPVRKFNARRDP
jgi:hypothetical protein